MISYRILNTAVATLLLMAAPASVLAVKSDYSASVEAELSDNATRVPVLSVNDTKVTTEIKARTFEENGPLSYDATASFRNVEYSNNSFDDQDYFRLSLNSFWQLFDRRLNINIRDVYDQRSIDSLDVVTPANTQDTNVFTFSAAMSFRLNKAQSLRYVPAVSDYYYEETLNDNRQTRNTLSWIYRMYRSTDISLSHSVNDIDYDRSLFTDLETTNSSFTVDHRRKRSEIAVSVGRTTVERTGSPDIDGATSFLRWESRFSGKSSLSLRYRNEITDTSSRLSGVTAVDNPDLGVFDVIVADVVENVSLRLQYTREAHELSVDAWISASEQDYQLGSDDRNVDTLGLRVRYLVSSKSNVVASITRNKSVIQSLTEVMISLVCYCHFGIDTLAALKAG